MKYLSLLFLLCVAATVPPIPKKALLSPKDAASKTVRLVWPSIKTNHITLMWDHPYVERVGFVIEMKRDKEWQVVGRVTNTTTFSRDTTNSWELYRVGTYWK